MSSVAISVMCNYIQWLQWLMSFQFYAANLIYELIIFFIQLNCVILFFWQFPLLIFTTRKYAFGSDFSSKCFNFRMKLNFFYNFFRSYVRCWTPGNSWKLHLPEKDCLWTATILPVMFNCHEVLRHLSALVPLFIDLKYKDSAHVLTPKLKIPCPDKFIQLIYNLWEYLLLFC